MTTLKFNAKKLSYFFTRLAWADGRIFGDIYPDHPIYGPIPPSSMYLDLVLKVGYIPLLMDQLNKPSPLARYMDEKSR